MAVAVIEMVEVATDRAAPAMAVAVMGTVEVATDRAAPARWSPGPGARRCQPRRRSHNRTSQC